MSSWYSNILTTTTSRLNNLQRQVFASEADGDTEDDTHVCRVLRQYYTENGRGLPPWLPPDPKAPPPTPVLQQPQNPGVGARYGASAGQGAGAGAGPGQGPGQGGLSSLRDNNRAAGRGGAATTPVGSSSRNPFARNAMTPDPSGRGGDGGAMAAAAAARPLTSQRTGSNSDVSVGGAGGAGGVSSAQDRLRQRLWGSGARTTSPNSTTGPFAPPPQQQPQHSGRSRGGGSGVGDYDPYGPGGQYDSGSGGGGAPAGRYGGTPPGRRGVGGLPGNPRMR